ncbi:putative quinol monooxygenase [Enterobacter cancerogenus]|uniref:putative quinol monooxygenase n=1 Tax=Enterobacter cancerogenus TaxID=69218 RepID=UPI0005391F2F|nr:putative quinol monooxygenase [Enterobacter cancerogenus]KGT91435.1 antibiotic biosynthesis monooxygenase [Enterobacter cancerogenus]
MTVPVVALLTAKPGCEDQAEKLFRGVIDETLQEEGCITYQLNIDSKNPRRFVWTEEWASQELLDKHLNAPHIVKLFADLEPLLEHAEVVALRKVAGGNA